MSEFNIFEAIGGVRQELPHSNVLAFLLNPRENHGLGDHFLKGLLKKISSDRNFDDRNLQETIVWREWQNIDILLFNKMAKLVVAIENKIGSGTSDIQLGSYEEIIRTNFSPGYTCILLLLTPSPQKVKSNPAFKTLNYDIICELVKQTLDAPPVSLSSESKVLLQHYAAAIEKHNLLALSSLESVTDLREKIRGFLKECIEKSGWEFTVSRSDNTKGIKFLKILQPAQKSVEFWLYYRKRGDLLLDVYADPKTHEELYKKLKEAIDQQPKEHEIGIEGWFLLPSSDPTKARRILSQVFLSAEEIEKFQEEGSLEKNINKRWDEIRFATIIPKIADFTV